METDNYIEVNEKIMVGKPVIKGTRITVEYILKLIEQGWPIEKIVAEHPRLSEESVKAAVSYARNVIETENVFPIK